MWTVAKELLGICWVVDRTICHSDGEACSRMKVNSVRPSMLKTMSAAVRAVSRA